MKKLKIAFLMFVACQHLIASQNPFATKQITQKQPQTKEVKKTELPKVKLNFDHNTTSVIKKSKFKLNAIIADFAFLNQKWVRNGDFVNGYEIKSIEEKTVTLTKNNETIKLGIGDEF